MRSMRGFWLLKGVKVLLLVALFVTGVGYVVMSLWNWLIPAVSGLHPITLAQAIGLLVLARLLVGGLRARRGWGWRARARFEQLGPEDREQLRAQLRRHCCGPTPAP